MKEKLMNNWQLKLLSMVCSFFLWLVVITITDPVQTSTFIIPIEFTNEQLVHERGKSVEVVGKQTVTIRVSKARTVVSKLTKADFRAVADYSKMYQDTQVPIVVSSLNSSVKDSEIEQEEHSVEVVLEDLKEVTRNIEYDLIGEPASGYAIGSVSLYPVTVTVTAPESFADLVRRAVVEIDVDGVSDDFETSVELKFYDGNDVLLDMENSRDVTIDMNGMVNCSVSVKAVQSVPITPIVEGIDDVAAGYRYTGIEMSPDKLLLSGLKSDMTRISSIEVGGLSVADASSDVVVEVDIRSYLPEGVDVYNGDHMVTFTMKVEPLEQREFVLNTSELVVSDIPDDLKYAITESQVTLLISGLKADLDQLEENGLKAGISLKGLTSGVHSVLVIPELPSEGYSQVGTSQITVNLIDPSTTAEETESSEDNSEGTTEETPEESPENSMEGSEETTESTEESTDVEM